MLEIASKSIYCTFIQYIEVIPMLNINKLNLKLNNNNLLVNSLTKSTSITANKRQWCNIVNVKDVCDISDNYLSICQTHCADNKWILMINPDDKPLVQLSSEGKIDPAKILKVNANKVNVNFIHIKNTLLKGNCSAIILAKTEFNQKQIAELSTYAEQGKTQCILVQQTMPQNTAQLH